MICTECVSLIPLKKFIACHGAFGDCIYCKKPRMCLQETDVLDYVAERILESHRKLDELSSFEQHMFFSGSDNIKLSPYWEIIQDDFPLGVAEFIETAIRYLEDRLSEDEHGQEQLFALDDGSLETNYYDQRWAKFVSDTHHGYRYFNFEAKAFLDSLFDFTCKDGRLKDELITTLTQDDKLYRARKVAKPEEWEDFKKNPGSALGPAPAIKAGDQRMTPSGISAMYCAFDAKTCLSEIRSVTGDLVISGAFEPVTKLAFLDLRKLEEMSKIEVHPFEVGYTEALHAHRFLIQLIHKLSKPKSSSDALGYISTQIVFEYLRLRFKNEVSGLIFPSVQTGLTGSNAVLFPENVVIAPAGYQLEHEDPIGPGDPFGSPIPNIRYSERSMRLHRITAVKTESNDYHDLLDYVLDQFL